MAFGEIIREGFVPLQQSELRSDRNDTLRRERRGHKHIPLNTEESGDGIPRAKGLADKLIERLGMGKFRRGGLPRS